jgi:hypothetical protein
MREILQGLQLVWTELGNVRVRHAQRSKAVFLMIV